MPLRGSSSGIDTTEPIDHSAPVANPTFSLDFGNPSIGMRIEMKSPMLRTTTALSIVATLIACGGSKKEAAEPAPPAPVTTEVQPKLEEKAQTPSERLGPDKTGPGLVVENDSLRAGSRFVAMLDEPVGPQFSREGQQVTAGLVPAQGPNGVVYIPEGAKVVLRVGKIQPAMSGSVAFVTLVPRTFQVGNMMAPVDARIVGVVLEERRQGGRPVNATGAAGSDVTGGIIKAQDLPPGDRERDILGRGTVITLGNAPPQHQLDKGTPLAFELRAPVPLALWDEKRSQDLNIGWIRQLADLQADPNELIGKRVELHNAKVHSVIGDVVFWVGSSADKRVLVVMDQFLDTPETKTIVKQGQTVSVTGVVYAMPPKEVAPLLWSMVTAKEATEFNQPVYVFAYKVSIGKAAGEEPKAKRRNPKTSLR